MRRNAAFCGNRLILYNTILPLNNIEKKKSLLETFREKETTIPSFSMFSALLKQISVLILTLNPFPNKPWFLPVCSTSLLKTLREKEKLLVSSNFSFSHSVFYPFRELSAIFIKFKIVVCKSENSFTRRQILDSSKLKEFVDDNFRFDENGRKLSKWVENTVGKGEIARCEQFLLFPKCFQKACFQGASKSVIVWEWVLKH